MSNIVGGIQFVQTFKSAYPIIALVVFNNTTDIIAGRMKEDSKGGIWIATEGGGVNYLDRKTKSFIEYKHSNQSNSLASNTIQALYLDEKNQILWIGTLKGGLDK